MAGAMAGMGGSYTQARAAAEPDKASVVAPASPFHSLGRVGDPRAKAAQVPTNQPMQEAGTPAPGYAPIRPGTSWASAATQVPQKTSAPAPITLADRLNGPDQRAVIQANGSGAGLGGSYADAQRQAVDGGGASPGFTGGNAVDYARQNGPSLADIQAEMQRRGIGAQLNANPDNSALAGYMMSN